MPIQPNGTAPYAPAATVLSVIDRARDRGLPTPVTKDVLMRAGVPESLIPRTLQSLQLLELITDDGTWTPNLEALRRAPQTEIQARLGEIVRSVYADVFQYVDPAKDNGTAVRDAFRSYAPHGQQERMVTLFLGLCQRAGIIAGETPAKQISREPRTARRSITPKPGQVKTKLPIPASHSASPNLAPPLAGLLATLPQSGWTKKDRDRFVTAFTVMLDYCIPVRSETELLEEQQP